MASPVEHPQYQILAIVIAVVTVIVSVFLYFLHNKRLQHLNATDAHPGGTNANIPQPHQETEESEASQSSPSASSSADPEPGHEFEVFLSFRGSDNRKKFTDCLYQSLMDAGVRAFRDNEELRVGEEIGPKLMKSIEQSKIAIPIFSIDYASSKWCLKEVEEMVKCMKETKQLIMPVFLDVTPDEVQHQRGSYAESFAQHEKRFSPETVRGWRGALQEVVKLKGLELETVANGNHGQFIKFIVTSVIRQLKKSYLEVSHILVGVEDRAEELMKRLEVGTDDVRIIGLWGMGGIGKTTLAKFVYNQIVHNFESSSFLDNIRETSRNHRGLQDLQSRLASDILKRDREDYANVEEGINVLKERIRHQKSLILLDDVDHVKQLEALAADPKWFGRGSRIIITTREKKVLKLHHVQDHYEVALLDKDQAFELFCQHAFRSKMPRTGFEKHAREVVNISGRLPLALEVIGSYLSIYGGEKDIWQSVVDIVKETPHKDVRDVLKISYDSLETNEKDIFLDIACYFIGMDVRLVKPMWLDCKFHPVVAIEILKLKALIKIGEDNTIWMHDQLRDLGRDIVKQENDKEPGGRSRVWHGEDAVKVLLGQGTPKVEAIRLEGDHLEEHEDCLDDKMFRNLSSLRVLELDRVRLDENFQHRFRWLRWLRWRGENISPLQNLILKNLVVLDLSRSKINEENFLGWSSTKMGMKLKVLNLRECGISKTPDLSAFPNLEILILAECDDLVWVDPSIGLLKNLILLDVRRCYKLEKLPEELGKMESLVELLIDHSRVTEIPLAPEMKKLEILSVSFCGKLKKLPDSIGQLTSIVKLTLSETSITCLPGHLGRLKKLKVLDASSNRELRDVEISDEFQSLSSLTVLKLCGVKSLPMSMSALSCLQTLHIRSSPYLEKLPELPSSLLGLDVEASLSKPVPLNLTNLANLKELALFGNFELKEECFSDLRKLETMSLACSEQETWPDFGNLLSLKQLSVWFCFLKKLPDLSNLNNLEVLEVKECYELVDIEGLGSLGNCLKVLSLEGCRELSHVEAVAGLESMRELDLSGCTGLRKLPNLSKLQSLEKINMSYGVHIHGFPAVLSGLTNLKWLHLVRSEALLAKLGDKLKALRWYKDYICSSHSGNATKEEEDKEARDLIDRAILTKADVDEIKSKRHNDDLIREVEVNGKTISIKF